MQSDSQSPKRRDKIPLLISKQPLILQGVHPVVLLQSTSRTESHEQQFFVK
jgi:hypothetical protein